MKPDLHILYCDCAHAEILLPQVKQEVRQALSESGVSYHAVPDLCELAAKKSPLLAELADGGRLTIAACHPRAVKWLFAAGGAPLPDAGVQYLDMREGSAGELVRSIRELAGSAEGRSQCANDVASQANTDSGAPVWQPWFPVLDYDLCQNCQQCLGFCLFGVFALDSGGKVQVQNPASCKTGCPACARVCPDNAIIFPKYPNAPINGGEVKDGDPAAEPVKLDKAALLNGDLLQVLRNRGKGGPRFSADPAQLQALRERFCNVNGSQRLPDIPLSALTAPPPKTEPL